jgi:hypothetical protein
MCGAEFFRQRPNFLIDGAEKFVQELATLDVVITVEKVRATHVLASYLVVNSSSVKIKRPSLYDELIIHCVDCSVLLILLAADGVD